MLLAMTLTLTIMAAACTSIERSRDLANPNVSAQTLAEQICSNCHGIGGRSISPNFPALAAQQPDYFIKEVKEFRNHSRSDPAGFEYMWGLSRSLTDEQIAGLAAYYSRQPAASQKTSEASGLTAAGQEVFEKGVASKNIPACSVCHGAQAQGQGGVPRLAGQHADYLAKQLTVFQRTDARPEGSIMKTIAHDLTEQNIESVTVFLQGLSAK